MNANKLTLDQLADDFDSAWRSGKVPVVAEYIDRAEPEWRAELLKMLVQIDICYRGQSNQTVSLQEYIELFQQLQLDPNTEFPFLIGDITQSCSPDDNKVEIDVFQPTENREISSVPKSNGPGREIPATLQQIGRYRIGRVVGKGGFGVVYLAHDSQLNRSVAIKVPHPHLVAKAADAEIYLGEASTVANLDHPHIVPVYDVGSTDQCPMFIVSKFIDGLDLATGLQERRPAYRQAAQWIAAIADALHYAHKAGLVHRDVKPSNILIGKDRQPYVVDFGLALREENIGQGPKYVGTPAYMSPEQARGEGHRVDGRSDIFSLGAVFYEMLVGRRAFRGKTLREVFEQITSHDPKPPRQYDDRIPKELERICLKALAKRATDRYLTAFDLAQDLRLFLQEHAQPHTGNSPATPAASPTSHDTRLSSDSSKAQLPTPTTPTTPVFADSQALKIVPKGLRSFDAHDADFFLELLPGPRDREGLPDSLRFWKTRIEEIDPDNTFTIGLIYGPSGCGKSSLVKAGLLPRLSADVISVYIETTPEETETRLLHGLRKRCPGLEDTLSLKDTLAALRRGQGIPVGKKVLIVLDQFEQWLHAKKEEENSDLVQALRQCDGGRVQCVVMVRDDFWMAVTRCLRELEVKLVEGHNLAAVDLFPERHAEKVLSAFGRAFGTLPDNISETTKDQKDFLTQSVAGLAEEGKVICVRLALFAEMMKGKAWTPATLKEVGGTSGVGVTFLEETFSSSAASPEHRYHQKAARAVLKDLLPNSGTDIKGYMRSHAELLEASGYGSRPKDFDDLIRILDSEIRLITPTDPEGKEIDDADSAIQTQAGQKYFQLTHDYLVHSLRDWLTRKQKETRQGRAELKLFDTSLTWNSKPENRLLPSLAEWINIRTLTDNRKWTEPQRKMMWRAAKVHGLNWGGALAVLLVLGLTVQYWVSHRDWNNKREQTRIAAESLQNNLGPSIPVNIRELKRLPESLVLGELTKRFTTNNSRHKLAIAFALAAYGRVETEYLVSRIDGLATSDTANLVDALLRDRLRALATINVAAKSCESELLWRRKAKLAITALALGNLELAVDMCKYEDRPDPGQRTVFINEFPRWEWLFPDRWMNLSHLAQVVAESPDAGLRSGISLGVGSLPVDQLQELNPVGLTAWKQLASRWYADHSDTATHSASSWLLRQWQLPMPNVIDQDRIRSGRDWFVNSAGMTMLRIQPPLSEPAWEIGVESDEPLEPEQAPVATYWIATCEVTRGQFEAFMQDEDYPFEKPTDWLGVDTTISPTADHPAQQVSWYDAVMYCNWLSRREGKTPVYKKTGKLEENVPGDKLSDQWERVEEANGYRLLSSAEWEFAARAFSKTMWATGGDEQFLADYCQMYPAKIAAIVGRKLPHAWGLHDMHGNVWEWCNDFHNDQNSFRIYRGGSWILGPFDCRSAYHEGYYPANRANVLGFRVARTATQINRDPSTTPNSLDTIGEVQRKAPQK